MPYELFGTGLSEDLYRNLIEGDRWKWILEGLCTTVTIALLAITIGTILGTMLAFGKISQIKGLRWFVSSYITIFRGTPLVVQLLIVYFGVFATVQFCPNSKINGIIIASISVGLNSSAYVAEIIRSGIIGVDRGQTEAAYSLGLSKRQTMAYVVLPQAIKNSLPTYTSEFIDLIKETAIVGYIGLNDLTKAGDTIRSRTYSAWIPLLAVTAIYLLLTSTLTAIFAKLERRLRKSDGK